MTTKTTTRIEGAVVLVTGANRGIGRAITEALLAKGAKKVYAAVRDVDTLGELRNDARIVPLQLDVTDAEQIRTAADVASDVDLVISNAGVALAVGTPLTDETILDRARREMDVNYFGPLQLVHQFAPTLAKNGGGAFALVGSIAGLTSTAIIPTYSASKAALHSLTQAARTLLGSQGTSVFGIYPGPVDTDINRGVDIPKASPRDVAFAILDGIEAGQEDIFPDFTSVEFGRQFEASPKTSERQMAAMSLALLSGAPAAA